MHYPENTFIMYDEQGVLGYTGRRIRTEGESGHK